MTQLNLSVNGVPIKIDGFVLSYLDHVVGGIIASLKDTGEIKNLELTIDNEGQVSIKLNGADVPLISFPNEIIKSTIMGHCRLIPLIILKFSSVRIIPMTMNNIAKTLRLFVFVFFILSLY